PAYTGTGSLPLSIFPKLSRNVLRNPSVVNLIQTGEAGELASFLQTNQLNNGFNFFANPNAIASDMLTNYSSSSYNSLQLVARRALRNGLTFEANYTFSKVLSDGDPALQDQFYAYPDAYT